MFKIVFSSVLLIIPIVLNVLKCIMLYYAVLAVVCMLLCSFMYGINFTPTMPKFVPTMPQVCPAQLCPNFSLSLNYVRVVPNYVSAGYRVAEN